MKKLNLFLSLLFIIQVLAAQSPSALVVKKDITYYEGPEFDEQNHKLNLVLPENPENKPLFIWIGGGAWSYVSREVEMNLAGKFAEEGMAVATIGHRLSAATWKDPKLDSGIKHPEHIKDLARAIRYLYVHADEYGYDKNKIFVGGYSSGAHLAALIVMDEKYLRNESLSKDTIKGIIPIAGTYDISHYYDILYARAETGLADNHVGSVFGLEKSGWIDASPSNYINNLTTPLLLISERNTYEYTSRFENQLREAGRQDMDVLHVHQLDHSGLWKDLSNQEDSRYRQIILDFIRKQSKGQPAN